MNGHYHLKEIVKEMFTVGKSCSGQRGSMLVGLIITLIIISVLGAAMLSFFSTSTMSQLSGNSSMQAYYLAESGFRYADGVLSDTSMSVRDATIESMHDTDYVLSDNGGRFNLKAYPYYFKTTTDPDGTTVLDAKVPGGFPPGLALTSGYVYIEDTPYQYSNATQSGNAVTFTRAGGNWPSIDSGTTIRSASMPDGSHTVTSINNYIDLETTTGSANAFPELNGTFRVAGTGGLWSYQKRSANRLEGVSPHGDPNWSSGETLSLDGTDYVILGKFVKLLSTGVVDDGTELETKRELTYYSSLFERYKTIFQERFADKSKWSESTLGAHEIKTIGGDSALKVTGTSAVTGSPTASLIKLKATAVNLETSRSLAGGYLSYDAQVKVGFEETSPAPTGGYEPGGIPPIPKYFAAGINFRLDDDNNCYGLSFMRGSNSFSDDNIPDRIVPVDDTLCLVLWQQTGPAEADRTWLAYKDLTKKFSDDVENGDGGWTASGLWHISEHRSYSSSNAWYYGREGSWDYNTLTSGTLESADIDLCGVSDATLTFWQWYDVRNFFNFPATFKVNISKDGGTAWQQLYEIQSHDRISSWQKITISIPSSYLNQTVKIRFDFNGGNSYWLSSPEGWYVDDVLITRAFPVNEATIAVRLIEAASVTFTGGTTEIEDGDIVTQSNGARGTVVGSPILSSGTWGGNAAGTLLLNNLPLDSDGEITVPFTTGLLNVEGKGSGLASVTAFRDRDNYIGAYYADRSGYKTADADGYPWDERRYAYPRNGDIRWPPGSLDDGYWPADRDYFTEVQWDHVNPDLEISPSNPESETRTIYQMPSKDEPYAILRSSESLLLRPDTLSGSELGLHTFGHGSLNVYFDDFAVQAEIFSNQTGFLSTVQQ